MNVADNIVKILEEEGIDTVFGIPGEQIMPLYKALSNSSINHVLTRHEQGAAHAADGYTRHCWVRINGCYYDPELYWANTIRFRFYGSRGFLSHQVSQTTAF